MHEHAIAQEIIREARKAAGTKPLERITIEVGDLAHLPAHEMKEALQVLLPGVTITTNHRHALVSCGCGFEGEPEILEKGHDHNVYRCPECRSMMPDILEGDKIILVSVDVPA